MSSENDKGFEVDFLEASDLFHGLERDQLEKLRGLSSLRVLAEGDELFRLGQEALELFIILDGTVQLGFPLEIRGQERQVRLEEKKAGETLAWSALAEPHSLTLNAVATTRARLVVFKRADLFELFQVCPQVGYRVMSNLSRVIGKRLQRFIAVWVRELQRQVAASIPAGDQPDRQPGPGRP